MSFTFSYMKEFVDKIPVTLSHDDREDAIEQFDQISGHSDTKWAIVTNAETGYTVRHYRKGR